MPHCHDDVVGAICVMSSRSADRRSDGRPVHRTGETKTRTVPAWSDGPVCSTDHCGRARTADLHDGPLRKYLPRKTDRADRSAVVRPGLTSSKQTTPDERHKCVGDLTSCV